MNNPLAASSHDHFVRNISLPVRVLRGLVSVLLLALSSHVWADGTETLGPPVGLAIQSGTGVIAAGVGLSQAQPGTINIAVPATATVQQVLLYWEGQSIAPALGDNTIVVNGNSITGSLIGGPTVFFGNVMSSSFRADITALGLVAPGANALDVKGLDFGYSNDGAGVAVIIDDGSGSAVIDVRDGNDLAFVNFAPKLDTTVPQTFNLAASPSNRTVNLAMFFGDVEGAISGFGNLRPTVIEITVNGVKTKLINALGSNDGEEWDTLDVPVLVPAGVTSVTVQAFSRDDAATGKLPASFVWIGAFLSVPPTCGDGQVDQLTETCDPPGSAIPGSTNICRTTCTYCGDGVLDASEECDDGADNSDSTPGACRTDCTEPVCGDGVPDPGETCDDGNTVDNDACRNNCSRCGDGVIDNPPEQCDDGNTANEDGCNSNCIPETCGDGIIQPGLGELCEPPNVGDCTADCHLPEVCFNFVDDDGDGLVDCLDPDCECGPIGRDPGAIRFGPTPGSDFLAVHGSFVPTTTGIDPVKESLGIRLTNADGEILKLEIPPGKLRQTGRNRYHFRDRQAQRHRSGLARLDVHFFPNRGNWTFSIKTYGDLSKATKAQMQLQWVVGDDPFLNRSEWLRTPPGWRLTLP